jgi:hypothetical protein
VTQPAPPNRQTQQVLAAVNSAALVTAAASEATTRAVWALWQRLNPYDQQAVAGFRRLAGQLVVSSQKTVATAIPATDAAPGKIFDRPVETYRYERSIGAVHDVADTKARQRIAAIVDDNMILSARLAAQQTLLRVAEKDERIMGYRRVIHPELSKGGVCGMCVAAADRVYHVKELQPIHTRCRCTIAPVTTAHDPGYTLNEDDLGRLYQHAADVAPDVRATSSSALKKTRYQIVHHHELGPVLTRVAGQVIPYASTTPAA